MVTERCNTQELTPKKAKAIEQEDFDLAKQIKDEISQLQKNSKQEIEALEEEMSKL